MRRSAAAVIDDLLSRPKFGTGFGFRRLSRLLRPVLQSPWGRNFSAVKITGSNGKGSVTALVHSILRSLGADCGRHTSPHLLRFHERIVIRDADISDVELESAFEWLDARLAEVTREIPGDLFGSFELITALCVRAFSAAGLPTAVMEAGIGGRYDPLRLLPGELVALTSIDLEHTELLGKTKEAIAYDKLDLCPDGGTVVALRQDEDLWDRIAAYCQLRRITLIDASERWKVELTTVARRPALDRVNVVISSEQCRLNVAVPLVGTFQLCNIAIACAVAEQWAARQMPNLARESFSAALAQGLSATKWPGRFEQISVDPAAIIDVGHTPDAVARVVESVRTFLPGRKLLLVTGVSADKAVEDILRILVPIANGIICTRAHHKGAGVPGIADIVRRLAPKTEVWEAATIEEAAALARQLATANGQTVLVAGGLFLAIEFRTAWVGADPRALRFY